MKEYELEGLEELRAELLAAANEYPDDAEKQLKFLGDKFKRRVLERTPTGGETKKARRELKEKKRELEKTVRKGYQRKSKKALDKSFTMEIKGYGSDMEADIQSKAPHFHLIERGHNAIAKDGRSYGFVPGVHMVEKTSQEFEDIVPQEMEKFLQKIIKKMRR